MISEFRAGAVLSESFRILLRHLPTLFTLTFVCFAPLMLLQIYEAINYPEAILGVAPAPLAVTVAGAILGMCTGPLLTGAITYAVFQALRGKSPTVGDSVATGLKRLLPLLGVAICSGLFIGVGLILFVIPGIIFACMVYVASVVCVVETLGVFPSLQRSREMTKGNRSTIFSIMFVLGFLWLALILLIRFTFEVHQSVLALALLTLAVQFVATMWNSTAAVVAYYHLRSLKESIDVDDIAKVFE